MTFQKYKEANNAALKVEWEIEGKPGDFEMYCFKQYKLWMVEA